MKINSKDLKEGEVKDLLQELEEVVNRSSSGKYYRKKLRDLGFKLGNPETWTKFIKSSELNKYMSSRDNTSSSNKVNSDKRAPRAKEKRLKSKRNTQLGNTCRGCKYKEECDGKECRLIEEEGKTFI